MATALAYPIFVLGLTVVVTGILLQFVVPNFARLYTGSHTPLPWPTRALLAASGILTHAWPALLLALLMWAVLIVVVVLVVEGVRQELGH